jgi:hypothetical protein
MLPAQIAYFDRMETARLAAAEVRPQPPEESAPGTVGVIESSAPAGSGG